MARVALLVPCAASIAAAGALTGPILDAGALAGAALQTTAVPVPSLTDWGLIALLLALLGGGMLPISKLRG